MLRNWNLCSCRHWACRFIRRNSRTGRSCGRNTCVFPCQHRNLFCNAMSCRARICPTCGRCAHEFPGRFCRTSTRFQRWCDILVSNERLGDSNGSSSDWHQRAANCVSAITLTIAAAIFTQYWQHHIPVGPATFILLLGMLLLNACGVTVLSSCSASLRTRIPDTYSCMATLKTCSNG